MSQIISKQYKGVEIVIGELSIKKGRKGLLTVIKVYHQGIGSEEDIFVFYFNKLLKEWILDLSSSMIGQTNKTNYRLIKEVYSNFKPSEPIEVQEFTDLLVEKHFDIFFEVNRLTRTERRFSLKGLLGRLFNKKDK